MRTKRVNCLGCLGATALSILLMGCPPRSGPGFQIAEDKDDGTNDAVVERALMKLDENAAQSRQAWRGKGFDAFEKSVYLEPFEGGKYIVNGDTPIASRKRLACPSPRYHQCVCGPPTGPQLSCTVRRPSLAPCHA